MRNHLVRIIAVAMLCVAADARLLAQSPEAVIHLPTGQTLTPLAAPGAVFSPLTVHFGPHPNYVADGAAAVVMSPDKHRMLVLTSGFNRYVAPDGKLVPQQSGQYILLYDIAGTAAKLVQTMAVPNAFSGIAWAPDGQHFYVGGGVDDVVYAFGPQTVHAAEVTVTSPGFFMLDGAPIKLNHATGVGVDVKPQAAGIAVSPDGKLVLVANYYNDSVSLIDTKTHEVIAEQDLRPGKIDPAQAGVPGGEYPFALAWRDNAHAYVSAARDREIVALVVTDGKLRVAGRIHTIGEPTALLYDAPAARLYATEDNDDRLAIINTTSDMLLAEPKVGLPDALGAGKFGKGYNPNSLALTPDHHLLLTLGGVNALAVLDPRDADTRVIGVVPTGWYPSGVATNADGTRVYVINRKSPPGPNPQGCAPKLASVKSIHTDVCGPANQYIYQLEKAGLLEFPMPTPRQLMRSTLQVAANIGLNARAQRLAADAIMAKLHAKIKHVIYIVKENRTYDQVLGDLEIGNGDPKLAILGQSLSPNHHAMAREFVTLDNFYDSGEQSSTGWTWSTTGRATDLLEKTAPVNYAQRGLAYDSEEADRNVPTALSFAERRKNNPKTPDDRDILPGPALATAPDGDRDDLPGRGFIWNAAVRAGLSVHNYGVADASVYDEDKLGAVPLIRDPHATHHVIYTSGDRDLATHSDPYFRGFDQKMPDYWRLKEWQRDYDLTAAAHKLPAFTVMRLSHDHFGDFNHAIDGVNTVETQMADNDYALGMLIDHISKGPAAASTLIFVIEDDAQAGADHVDARRSIAFIVGPYVKHKALVSTRYTTINMLRTIEGILGLRPMGLNDALAAPMAGVFDLHQAHWDFNAHASRVLMTTALPIAPTAYVSLQALDAPCRLHDAAYWAEAMKGQDFSTEDKLDTNAFNAALWRGLGQGVEPAMRSGADLRANRAALLGQRTQCPQ